MLLRSFHSMCFCLIICIGVLVSTREKLGARLKQQAQKGNRDEHGKLVSDHVDAFVTPAKRFQEKRGGPAKKWGATQMMTYTNRKMHTLIVHLHGSAIHGTACVGSRHGTGHYS